MAQIYMYEISLISNLESQQLNFYPQFPYEQRKMQDRNILRRTNYEQKVQRNNVHKEQENDNRIVENAIKVYNINDSISNEQLKDLFSEHGFIEYCNIEKNENGKSRQFAYIVYLDKECADKCIEEFQKHYLDGRLISIQKITLKEAAEKGLPINRHQHKSSVSKKEHSPIREIREQPRRNDRPRRDDYPRRPRFRDSDRFRRFDRRNDRTNDRQRIGKIHRGKFRYNDNGRFNQRRRRNFK
eukprot:TRINITY_DN2927_c0_g1_i2.p2 TRINITY_DN2927_c0_g1~~TRINITY_DN2927_c0_g1_i2.p2  ORF type:complete len:242 (+),score=33.33 TRINITY_DN2927_c0_g1_i2:242-967(+)